MTLPKAFAYFNGPLFVPEQGRHALRLLEEGGTRRFLDELERLSTLGSPWAAAILGYIALVPGPEGKRDASRAADLCRTPANRGDSYAQFVFAWAMVLTGETKAAFDFMKKAAVSGFPPATLDFTTLLWSLSRKTPNDAATAVKALRLAYRAGHSAAPAWRYHFYKSGHLGLFRRVMGYVLMPVARLRFMLATYRDPFSCKVFLFASRATAPLLRDQPRMPFLRQLAKNLREELPW